MESDSCPNVPACFLAKLIPLKPGWRIVGCRQRNDEKILTLQLSDPASTHEPENEIHEDVSLYRHHIADHILDFSFKKRWERSRTGGRGDEIGDHMPLEECYTLDECRRSTSNIFGAIVSAAALVIAVMPVVAGADSNAVSFFGGFTAYEASLFSLALLVQYFRIFMGINFMEVDQSFVATLSVKEDRRKILFDRWSRGLLLLAVLAFPFGLRINWEYPTIAAVILIALLPVVYSLVFSKNLFCRDQDKLGNFFIAINDGLFALATGLCLFHKFGTSISLLTMICFPMLLLLVVVFLVEIVTTYYHSLVTALKRCRHYFVTEALR